MANRCRNDGNSERLYLLGLQNHCRWWLQLWNEKTFAPWEKSCDQPRQHIKKQRHYFAYKCPYSPSYGFSSSHVQMWEVGHKEGWALKNWCFWTVVLVKTPEIPLDSKEIKPVNPRGNQPWIFIGRADAEAEALILWPPDGKNWLIWKDPDAGKDWRQEEKGTTEDEMVGWHHWLNGLEFAQALGNGDGPGSLAAVHVVTKSQLSNWTTTLFKKHFSNRAAQPESHPWHEFYTYTPGKESGHLKLRLHCWTVLLLESPSFSQVKQAPITYSLVPFRLLVSSSHLISLGFTFFPCSHTCALPKCMEPKSLSSKPLLRPWSSPIISHYCVCLLS